MIDRTPAVVLHTIKYSDSGVVVNLYTEKYGRMAVMIKGAGNRKAGRHKAYLQPLSVIDLVLYYRATRELQTVREFSILYLPSGITGNFIKSSIAIFLGEVLASVLREETAQKELFNYLVNSVKYLDKCETGILNFHIGFLAGLCSYLGIEPHKREDPGNRIFDLLNGCFVPLPPAHGNYADTVISEILSKVFESTFDNLNNIPMTGQIRNEALNAILKYYSVHFPSLKKINSLDVLREVFSS